MKENLRVYLENLFASAAGVGTFELLNASMAWQHALWIGLAVAVILASTFEVLSWVDNCQDED